MIRGDEVPFVGRRAELADMRSALAGGAHLLLRGPAGIGKTRLVAEVVARETSGRTVERLQGSLGRSGYQLGIFLLASDAGSAGLPHGTPLDHIVRRWQSERSRSGPSLVWVDDASRIDDLSASLLREATGSGLIQLLATARSGERLPADLDAMVVDETLVPVPVPPLDPAETAELAAAWSPAPLTILRMAEVHRLAGGFPLFVRELVRATPGQDSEHLADLVDRRLDALPEQARRVAEMIAAVEPVSHRVFGADAAVIVDLVRSGLVVWHDAEHLALEHPYYSSALLDRLGPLSEVVYGNLVDRTDHEHVDPVLLTEWTVRAGRTPDPDLVGQAARLALGRYDVPTARRLAAHAGAARALLEAEAYLVEGDTHAGLAGLDAARRSDLPAEVRVEAASSQARHVGLTLGDIETAHEILTSTDAADLPPAQRRLLLLGRLWLWMFGPVTDVPEHLEDLLRPVPEEPDWLSFEVLSSGIGAMLQGSGATRSAPALRRLAAWERDRDVDAFVWARTRCVEAAFHLHDGDVRRSLRILGRAFDDDSTSSGGAAMCVVAGNLALHGALAGRFGLAGRAAVAAREASEDNDQFRFGEIARLVHLGNHRLAAQGPDPATWPQNPPPGDAVLTIEAMAAARSAGLAGDAAALASGVLQLIDYRAFGWLAYLYADAVDDQVGDVHSRVHLALADLPLGGTWATIYRAARARCENDPAGLLGAGEAFLDHGIVSGALRAFADATRRAAPGSSLQHAGRRGVVRALMHWEAPRPGWVADLSLPTDRQLRAAELVVRGHSVAEVADQWCVSRRTVENHLYRASRVLGLSGQADLLDTLGPELSSRGVRGE